MQHFQNIIRIFMTLQILFSIFPLKWGIKSTSFWKNSLNLSNVVNFNADIHNIVSTLIWRCPTSRSHVKPTTTLKQRLTICWGSAWVECVNKQNLFDFRVSIINSKINCIWEINCIYAIWTMSIGCPIITDLICHQCWI